MNSPQANTPIKVAITEDHHMVIEGLTRVLNECPHIEVVAHYTHAAALINGLKQSVPDVLLLDVQLPDQQGHEIAKTLVQTYPAMRILVLSGIDSHFYIRDMIRQGCGGYLLKSNADKKLLVSAIEKVHQGETFLDPSIKEMVVQEMLKEQKKSALLPKITAREKEVLQLIVNEFDNQEIARRLFISLRTVENHRYNLLQKLDVKNTVGLVRIAMQMGMLKKPI